MDKRLEIIFLILSFACPAGLAAQDNSILAITGAASMEELDETETEHYQALLNHPIDINTATLSRLKSCGLFTNFQAVSLDEYRRTCGDILSISELASVDGFNQETTSRLAPFISISSKRAPGQQYVKENGFELIARAAYQSSESSRWSYGAKARLESKDRWTISGAARKTYSSSGPGPDGMTFCIAGYGRRKFGTSVIGNFNARFGQGLTLWSGFSMSGTNSTSAMVKHTTGISPSWSFSGTNNLTGAATSLEFRHLTLSCISYIPELQQIIEGRNVTAVHPVYAINCSHIRKKSEFGVTGTAGADGSLKTGMDFRWTPGEMMYFGEVCTDIRNGCIGAISGARWTPAFHESVTLTVRHYPVAFQSSNAAGLRSGSKTSGEDGICMGISLPWLEMTGDMARLIAKEQLQARFNCRTMVSFGTLSLAPQLRFKWNNSAPHRMETRLDAEWQHGGLTLHARADYLKCIGNAWLAYGECGHKSDRLSIWARYGIFKVDNWDDRIYVYERDAPGSFNVPAYYGRGFNGSLVAGYKGKRQRIHFRLSRIHYVSDKKDKYEVKLQYSLVL